MADMWVPGAERREQGQAVTLDRSLPARATWHITADRLDDNGNQPPMDNVGKYLENVAYCPHIMWDPFTGRMIQYYPADVGARALTRWNEDGVHNVQVEIYFAYGTNREGKRWNSVAETPCKGFGDLLNWMDSLGIPRVWPMGPPVKDRNVQSNQIWNAQAGHYGHSQVPGETHSDPGPMPSLAKSSMAGPASAPPAERELLIPGVPGIFVD